MVVRIACGRTADKQRELASARDSWSRPQASVVTCDKQAPDNSDAKVASATPATRTRGVRQAIDCGLPNPAALA